jgi:hypothetical protein
MNSSLPLLPALFVIALASGAAGQKGWFTHDVLGFKVKVPDGWTEVPLRVDENWIVGKFLSDKTYISKSRDWNEEHRPLMTVTVFTDDAKKFKPLERQQRGSSTFVAMNDLPYQNYQDYLKRNLQSGYFFEKEDLGKHGDIDCIRYEVNQHKSEVKMRLIAWVFKTHDMDVAVEFEVLEDRLDRLRKDCEEALSSFRFIERKAIEADAEATGKKLNHELWTKFRSEWRKLPAKERMDRRREIEKNRLAAVRARTPAGWDIQDTRNYLVVSHTDKRYVDRCLDAADAFRAWCEKHLDGLSDEYVRKGVLRVCADADEFKAYSWKVSGDSWSFLIDDDREVVTYFDTYNGTSGRDMGFITGDIFDMYLQDKDALMFQYTPAWLLVGMRGYVTGVQLKGKKLVFKEDDWEREDMRELERESKLKSVRELMTLDEDAFWDTLQNDRRTRSQLVNLFRFLDGPGGRHKLLKDFVKRYLQAVAEVAEEFEAKWEKEGSQKEAQTEEEEEAQRKSRDSYWRKRRKEIAEALEQKVLAWSDRDWDGIQKAYEKFIK